jgi:hypothetical protein
MGFIGSIGFIGSMAFLLEGKARRRMTRAPCSAALAAAALKKSRCQLTRIAPRAPTTGELFWRGTRRLMARAPFLTDARRGGFSPREALVRSTTGKLEMSRAARATRNRSASLSN